MPASPVEPADRSHITKLDPDKELSDEVADGEVGDVGDVAHEEGLDALRETVRGAKDAR